MSNSTHSKRDLIARVEKIIKNTADFLDLEVADGDEFFQGVLDRFCTPSIDDVVSEEFPLILRKDPKFFLRNQLYLGNVSGRLEVFYGEGTPAFKIMGAHALPDAVHSFKVDFRHVRFFMIDHPDRRRLQYNVNEIRRILNGAYINEDSAWRQGKKFRRIQTPVNRFSRPMPVHGDFIIIPNILEVGEEHICYFESFNDIYVIVGDTLPFIKEAKVREIARRITSYGNSALERANFAKKVIEGYLIEARFLLFDKKISIPEFYNTSGVVYRTIIQPARDGLANPYRQIRNAH